MNENELKEVILDLLLSYYIIEGNKPSAFELMSVENALLCTKDKMEEDVRQSYIEWIERWKVE
jgi:hypothetical protein